MTTIVNTATARTKAMATKYASLPASPGDTGGGYLRILARTGLREEVLDR